MPTSTPMQLGMVGLGRMGAGLVGRLMRDGHHCVVYDVNPEAVTALEKDGATGANSMAEFVEKLTPPRAAWVMVPAGDITDKTITVPASKWIRNSKTKKDLDVNWVFAGSQFAVDPTDKQKPPMYLANHGDIICVCNIEDAMLDLPVESTKSFDDRVWEANSDRIPPIDTKVTVILEPVPDKDKPKK